MSVDKKRVLVIDDDANILQSIARQLKNEDLDIQLESNPLAGIERVTGGAYDLVLCDVKMKPIGGLDVLRATRECMPTLPFVIITAFVDDQVYDEAQRLGCTDYLLKPVPRARLVESVRRILTNSEEV